MNSAIVFNTCKEKMRKKDWIIFSIVILFLLLFFSSNASNLTISGKSVTDFEVLLPIFLVVGSVVCGLTSVFMSAGAIPLEYARKNSYLVWSRNISQQKYHISVAVGSALCTVAITGIFYVVCAIFILLKSNGDLLSTLPVAFLLTLPVLLALSFLTSAISVKLPAVVATVIMTPIFILGVVKSMLFMLASSMQGGTAPILRWIMNIMPDFYDMISQAGNYIQGKDVDMHMVIGPLLLLYFGLLFLYILRRKEA